eukprot:1187239-Prorocentrum_minimum.AAC.3
MEFGTAIIRLQPSQRIRAARVAGSRLGDGHSKLQSNANPKVYTLNPKPYTLHPTPYTLHPTP